MNCKCKTKGFFLKKIRWWEMDVDVPLFETIKTNAGTQPKNELKQWALVGKLLSWCLLRNCKETAAKPPLPPKTAICRRIFFFCHFSLNYTFLNYLSPTFFFFKKFTLTFALNTCDFFGWIVKYLKYYKCQMQKCWEYFFEKKDGLKWFHNV